MFRVKFVGFLCLLVPVSPQPINDAPINCVLNEKRANPVNNQTYYYCLVDGPTLYSCPEETTFDVFVMDCVIQLNSADSYAKFSKYPMADGAASEWNSIPAPLYVQRDPTGDCPDVDGETPTYFSDDKDCKKFYECSHGTPEPFVCPDDLVFNPSSKVCDTQANVGCSSTNELF